MITIAEDIELEGLDDSLGKLFKKKRRKKAVAQVKTAAKSILGTKKDQGAAPADEGEHVPPGDGSAVAAPALGSGIDWWLWGGIGLVVLGLGALFILRKKRPSKR